MPKVKLTPCGGLWSVWAQRQALDAQSVWLHLGTCRSLRIAGYVAKAIAQQEAAP